MVGRVLAFLSDQLLKACALYGSWTNTFQKSAENCAHGFHPMGCFGDFERSAYFQLLHRLAQLL
ncbi:hypothetical protein SAMN02799636_05798 [Methylobacterium sp. 275MFSha3.1]|nr:hypothetical protein SAMN02799636_05798 [Methylobacterium sp. 275MFSha3.1]